MTAAQRPIGRLPGKPGWLAALAVSTLLLGGCGVIAQNPTTSMPTAFGSAAVPGSPMAVALPSEETTPNALTPVYWLGSSGSDVSLYREFLRSERSGDPIAEAVQAMTDRAPLDEDYFTPWQPADRVTTSISSRNEITVDISSDAFGSRLDAGVAHRAVQQLVYTATAAAANAGLSAAGYESSVRILVDGKAGYTAFGHEPLDGPIVRDPALVAPVWIIDPQDSISALSPVTVKGTAVTGPARLVWQAVRVVDGRPSTTAEQSGDAALGGALPGETGSFEFTVELPPGEYILTVHHAGEFGSGDSKRLTIGDAEDIPGD